MPKQKQKTIFVHNMFSPCSELVVFLYWTGKSMNNLLSYCGLVDVRINASDKDLPVTSNDALRQSYNYGQISASILYFKWKEFCAMTTIL